MSVYIVDSSVAIKWYLPEMFDDKARILQTKGVPLHAPDFIEVEIAAILWKKQRKGEINRADGHDTLKNFAALTTLIRHSTAPLVTSAFDLADQTNRTVYDCLYLALAVQLGGAMVTADEKLVNAIAGTTWAGHIMKLQDIA